MNNCEILQRMISDFHDDRRELPHEVVEHLRECKDCSRFHSVLISQSQLLADLPDGSKPTASSRTRHVFRRAWNAKLTIPLPMAAIFLLLFLGLYMLNGNSQTQWQYRGRDEQPSPSTQEIQIITLPPQRAYVSFDQG
jgi:predicted anti-sigma-YlaC factor YlaD